MYLCKRIEILNKFEMSSIKTSYYCIPRTEFGGYYGIREFLIVRERRHVTPCLSSAPSSTGYCEPVCGQREIGRFGVQDLYVDVYDLWTQRNHWL